MKAKDVNYIIHIATTIVIAIVVIAGIVIPKNPKHPPKKKTLHPLFLGEDKLLRSGHGVGDIRRTRKLISITV